MADSFPSIKKFVKFRENFKPLSYAYYFFVSLVSMVLIVTLSSLTVETCNNPDMLISDLKLKETLANIYTKCLVVNLAAAWFINMLITAFKYELNWKYIVAAIFGVPLAGWYLFYCINLVSTYLLIGVLVFLELIRIYIEMINSKPLFEAIRIL